MLKSWQNQFLDNGTLEPKHMQYVSKSLNAHCGTASNTFHTTEIGSLYMYFSPLVLNAYILL